MYKKKLGVRVVTAVTVGSLLCSNASVAMAAEQVSSLLEKTTNEETTNQEEISTKDVTVRIQYYDAETKKTLGEGFKHVTVTEGADAIRLGTDDIEDLTVDGVTYTVSSDTKECVVSYGNYDEVRWAVAMNKVKEVADTKEVKINFFDEEAGKQVEERVITVDADATHVNINTNDYKLPGYEILTLGDLVIRDGYVYVRVRKTEQKPDVETANAALTVIYKNNGKEIDRQNLTANGKKGEKHTFVEADLVLPAGYVLDGSFKAEVAYGDKAEVVVNVIAKDAPIVEEVPATLNIEYVSNGKVVKTQTETRLGERGEIFTFNNNNVELTAPEGYKLLAGTKLKDTAVKYGETKTVDIKVYKRTSGGGGSSSGGSSGGGSTRGTGVAQKLTNGRWILDSVGWWYPFNDNTYAKGGWYYLEWQNKMDWYYFDNNGYLVSGWFEENGNKYYLHDLHDGTFGRMYTGWNKIADKWYYFNNTTNGTFGALDANAQVPAELLNK